MVWFESDDQCAGKLFKRAHPVNDYLNTIHTNTDQGPYNVIPDLVRSIDRGYGGRHLGGRSCCNRDSADRI